MCAVQKDYFIPAIIIDFGTATTYDVINSKNQFIGGVIAAGVETSAHYLINQAALLSDTELLLTITLLMVKWSPEPDPKCIPLVFESIFVS